MTNTPQPRRFPIIASLLLSLECAAVLAATGCTSGRTYVLEKPTLPDAVGTINVKLDPGSVAVTDQAKAKFAHELDAALACDPKLTVSPDAPLTLSYRFIYNDPGNTVVRVGSNIANIAGSPVYGFGDGAVALEVDYLDASGKRVGQIVTDGPIAGAFGNTDEAVKTAAKQVAAYTKEHYANLMLKK